MLVPLFLRTFFPSLTWNIPVKDRILFLTFDDGPIPEVTPWVLDLLKENKVMATFFCVGENVNNNPDIFQRIIGEGHAIGNHTQHHLNGWKTDTKVYIRDVDLCAETLKSDSRIFRPPYGKMKSAQIASLKSRYRIIMWDVIAWDWKTHFTAERCFERIKRKAKPGSILVFHDSLKAAERMKPALEKTIRHFSGLGYRFELLTDYL